MTTSHSIIIAAAAAIFVLLSGCTTLRTERVGLPSKTDLEDLAASTSAPYYGPPGDNLKDLATYARNVSKWTWKEADERAMYHQFGAEGGFVSTSAGVIAGMTGHQHAARFNCRWSRLAFRSI
jgi:hypothetical protein